jgi:hypothetical protein
MIVLGLRFLSLLVDRNAEIIPFKVVIFPSYMGG